MTWATFKLHGAGQIQVAVVNPVQGTVELNGISYEAAKLSWDTPISGTVYGTLLNYKGELEALGNAVNQTPYLEKPKAPVLYIKPVNTLNSHGKPIPLPDDCSNLEMRAALGVVFGRKATRVSEAEALNYVQGYTVVNDVSVPHESFHRPAVKQKARDGFCPVGPWVIERDAVENPDALEIRVFVNDELRQENNTSNLIRHVARLIAEVTEFMTLDAGDMLLVGVPEGAPLAKAGDRVRIEISGVGTLENVVVPEEQWFIGGAGV